MKIVDVLVSELIPYANNPRDNANAVEAVTESIRKYGFRIPLVIDAEKCIVAGHTRLEAAKRLGLETVPCVVADDLTDEQIRAFRLADNKVAEFSEWDYDRLAEEMGDFSEDAAEFFEEDGPQNAKNVEIDLEDFGEEGFKYECDACGFRFDA